MGRIIIGDQFVDVDSLMRRLNKEGEYGGNSTNFFEGSGSGDDQLDAEGHQQSHKRKKHYRHTRFQIDELEKSFNECPHPDYKERLELSRKLGLETRQVKFWFQNRRTHVKSQLEKHENILMKEENEKLRAENEMIREGLNDPLCINCGGGNVISAMVSLEQQKLQIENARLKEEFDRVSSLIGKLFSRPDLLSLALSQPYASNGYGAITNVDAPPTRIDFADPCIDAGMMRPPPSDHEVPSLKKSVFVDFAMAAMNELFTMVHADEPLWVKCPQRGGDREMLNLDEYAKIALPSFRAKRNGFITEASREIGSVMIDSTALAEMLMDLDRWAETFYGVVSKSSVIEVISDGVDGSKNGTLQWMQADFQVISTMVPARQERFLRFCKKHGEDIWAVVDVSFEGIQEVSSSSSFPTSMRRPSGCFIQDMPNGYSKVTWVEHSEYDETSIHPMLRPVISSGIGFGSKRWLSTLQRYCEFLNILMASFDMLNDPILTKKKTVLRMAKRMVDNFCSAVVSNGDEKWEKLTVNNESEGVKILARKSLTGIGEVSGFVLGASTSVWLPFSRQRLFNFLNENSASWDIVTKDGKMEEIFRIPKAHAPGNNISLLRGVNLDDHTSHDANQMAVLQESWHDASGSLVVYAPVSVASMEMVMKGGGSTSIGLLPSGYAILPDGVHQQNYPIATTEGDGHGGVVEAGGSILTIGFQILVNTLPTTNLTKESVDTVNNLLSCTIQRIKDALQKVT